jgi:hypothetical protein
MLYQFQGRWCQVRGNLGGEHGRDDCAVIGEEQSIACPYLGMHMPFFTCSVPVVMSYRIVGYLGIFLIYQLDKIVDISVLDSDISIIYVLHAKKVLILS